MNKLILSTIALLSFGMSVILAQEKDSYDPWIWESEPPEDCPFEQSTEIVGVALTENYRHYKLNNCESYGDTWYPTWAPIMTASGTKVKILGWMPSTQPTSIHK